MSLAVIHEEPALPIGAREHNRYQRAYYERQERKAIAPSDSPYVRRHLERVIAAGELGSQHRLLEVGAGVGRYTRLFLQRGFNVTASDLSPVLLARLRAALAPQRITTLTADVAAIDRCTRQRFDRVVGLFVLHHLRDFDAVFASLARVLVPGGRVVFCEPNGYNPLFYLQIALSRGMTWRGDGGIRHMRPRLILGALARAGFTAARVEHYGFFPPRVANTRAGAALERVLERVRPLAPLRAFTIFTATCAG